MKYVMDVEVLRYCGLDEALRGLQLNKHAREDRLYQIARKLAPMDYGHNKFLESIIIWASIKAPRYWWAEADTYRLSTKQSESTINLLLKQLEEPFDEFVKHFEPESINRSTYAAMQSIYQVVVRDKKQIYKLKRLLPEGYLQKRVWCFSLKTFRNMVIQRATHILPHWRKFLLEVRNQLPSEYVDLIGYNDLFEKMASYSELLDRL